jgi:hypothetical protein
VVFAVGAENGVVPFALTLALAWCRGRGVAFGVGCGNDVGDIRRTRAIK